MAASFGSFVFAASEFPTPRQSYRGWRPRHRYDIGSMLGAAKDDVVDLGNGSKTLVFENIMTQARYDTAYALEGSSATFSDFDTVPNTRTALLEHVTVTDWFDTAVMTSSRRVRVRWEFREV